MLHIGKYFGYIFRGAHKILFYPFKARKYIKNKDAFPLIERYDFVHTRAMYVLEHILKMNLEVTGLDKLNPNDTYLFVPNHQSLLDPVTFLSLFDKPLMFVSKKENDKLPIVSKMLYITDTIYFDRNSPRDALNMVKTCNQYLNGNQSVVIFPEGTRSKEKQPNIGEYKAGAFKCAYKTNAKIVPVVIDGTHIPLSIKKKNTGVIKIHFLEPIIDFENLTTLELAQKVENMARLELEKMRQ